MSVCDRDVCVVVVVVDDDVAVVMLRLLLCLLSFLWCVHHILCGTVNRVITSMCGLQVVFTLSSMLPTSVLNSYYIQH